MKNTIFGANYQIKSLVETLFNTVAVFESEGEQYYAYSLQEVDDENTMLTYDDSALTPEARTILATSLFYRFQDSAITGELKLENPLPEPLENHFRLVVNACDYEKYTEEYFIYNAIPQENFATIIYPLNINMGIYKAELIAINLTDEKMSLLSRQGKTQQMAKKINQRITKVSDTLTASTKIVMSDVINPAAKAAVKAGATIASSVAKTAVDCMFVATAEIMKDASSFSLAELKKKEEVNTIKYCTRKILNKGQETAVKQARNNFNF